MGYAHPQRRTRDPEKDSRRPVGSWTSAKQNSYLSLTTGMIFGGLISSALFLTVNLLVAPVALITCVLAISLTLVVPYELWVQVFATSVRPAGSAARSSCFWR